MATITSVDIYLGLSSAKSGFDVIVDIHALALSGADPDSGTKIGTKSLDVSNVPLISGAGPDWVTFTFATPITVNDDNFAGIVFRSDGSQFNQLAIRHYDAQDYLYYVGVVAGSEICYIDDGGGWDDQGSGKMLCYRINGTDITQNVADNPDTTYEVLGGNKHGWRSYVDGDAGGPPQATTPSPADDATGVDLNLSQISWDMGAAGYTNVYFGEAGAMSNVDVVNTDEYYDLSGETPLTNGQEYEWRVDTYDGSLTTGVVWSFTAGGASPSKATTPAPADVAANILLGLGVMTWVDGGDADTFNVYFGPSGNMQLVSSAQAGLSFSIGYPLNYNTTYQWRIDSTNEFGTTTGDTWSYSCIPFSPPLPTGLSMVGSGGPNGEGTPTGTPSGFNNMITVRKLCAVAEHRFWYESI